MTTLVGGVTQADARRDGYTDFDKEDLSNGGRLNPFSGLRGDAKALYKDVVHGREKRVSLCKVRPEEATRIGTGAFWKALLATADLIVVATGSGTAMVPIRDSKGDHPDPDPNTHANPNPNPGW